MFRSFCDDYKVTCNQFRNLFNSKHFKNIIIRLFNKKKFNSYFFLLNSKTDIKTIELLKDFVQINTWIILIKQVLNHNLYDGLDIFCINLKIQY